jgi:hypothetical protein
MKARLYTKNNISRFYLSPYVEYIVEDGKIILRNDLFNKVVITPLLKTSPETFIDRLREGIDETMIQGFLGESFSAGNPADVLAALMQKGIIE